MPRGCRKRVGRWFVKDCWAVSSEFVHQVSMAFFFFYLSLRYCYSSLFVTIPLFWKLLLVILLRTMFFQSSPIPLFRSHCRSTAIICHLAHSQKLIITGSYYTSEKSGPRKLQKNSRTTNGQHPNQDCIIALHKEIYIYIIYVHISIHIFHVLWPEESNSLFHMMADDEGQVSYSRFMDGILAANLRAIRGRHRAMHIRRDRYHATREIRQVR